jgi:uncharacterized repeat protein (TIGR01451 family)
MLALAVALGIGMALSAPALGAELHQASGKMTGLVMVGGRASSGVSVELRQRTNSGADSSLATTSTDASGTYTFANTPSAPSDAFYYVRFTGGKGMLATWYTFPIIYVTGSDFTVPSVELGDVQLIEPTAGQPLSLPGALLWNGRTSGETYRVFIYAAGKTDKPLLDSGSLGTGTRFDIARDDLPDGKYEGVVQVRDAVSGYGQSQNRFNFTVGDASALPPTVAPAEPTAVPVVEPTIAPTNPEVGGEKPDVRVNLSADKVSVVEGDKLVYRVEVENLGDAPAQDVVLTNLLPAGVTVNGSQATSSTGSVAVEGNNVTAQLGEIAPNAKVVVEIPVSVSTDAGSNVSNQVSVMLSGVTDPVRSNAYIAQVTESLTGAPPTVAPDQPKVEPTPNKPAATVQPTPKPSSQAGGNPPSQPDKLPPSELPKPKPIQEAKPLPQTGGAFPIVFAIVLVVVTLFARYLRGRTYRRT